MKNIIIVFLSLFLLSSCVTANQKHYIQKVDGTWVSKKKFNREMKRVNRNVWKKFNKKELNDLFNNTNVLIDTTTNK